MQSGIQGDMERVVIYGYESGGEYRLFVGGAEGSVEEVEGGR